MRCCCRVEGTLRILARHMAETVERDSRALVRDVCVHMLGAAGGSADDEDAPARQMSSSCSDEVPTAVDLFTPRSQMRDFCLHFTHGVQR